MSSVASVLKHSISTCMHSLNRKSDCFVSSMPVFILGIKAYNGQALVLRSDSAANDLGIGSHGKIDYLHNYKNYCVHTFFSKRDFDTVKQSLMRGNSNAK